MSRKQSAWLQWAWCGMALPFALGKDIVQFGRKSRLVFLNADIHLPCILKWALCQSQPPLQEPAPH